MTAEDILAVCELLCACFRWLSVREAWSPEQLAFMVDVRGSVDCVTGGFESQTCLVACDGETIVGFTAAEENEITRMYVLPDYHRKGVGRSLFTAMERGVAEKGHSHLTATVIGPSAVPFYESMGMEIVRWRRAGAEVFADRKVAEVEKRLVRGGG